MASLSLKLDECHKMLAAMSFKKGVELNLPISLPAVDAFSLSDLEVWVADNLTNGENLVCLHNMH